MPAYTFRCRKCSHGVVVEHSMSEPHPRWHAGCGGELVRVFDVPEVVYKGSGFYTTDKRLDEKPEE